MRFFCLLFISIFSSFLSASELPTVRVGVLHGGTVSWELQAMQSLGFDRANGFQLEVMPYANMSATRLALSGGSVDAIVSDWLWAGKREAQAQSLWFVPFSSSIGAVLVPANSTRRWPDGLKGARIGVAGGPFSKGWVLVQASAARVGIDPIKEAEVSFAAPPLLNNELRHGRLDMLVTFWHFGARLQSEGYKTLVDLPTLMDELGMGQGVPMLGYLFPRSWALQNAKLAKGFEAAVSQTKASLAQDDGLWQQIRPLMKAEDEGNFLALRDGFRAGIPAPLTEQQIEGAQRFYQMINQTQTEPLNRALFRPFE